MGERIERSSAWDGGQDDATSTSQVEPQSVLGSTSQRDITATPKPASRVHGLGLVPAEVVGQVSQILLPMIAGIAATKADLTEWVYGARTDSSAPTAERGRRGDRGAQGQAREGANS